MIDFKKVPRKYHPKGFEILYEDQDLIIGNKAPGFLTVSAQWNRDQTIHSALNSYVRKGQLKSRKCVYVIHRLDQHTSGVLMFAKSERVQNQIKDEWKNTEKLYYAIVHGKMPQATGHIESYLTEDEDYVVHSSKTNNQGKLARTEYSVLKEVESYSLLKIRLLTGRKNQIRVHLADEGHPVVGDAKYGKSQPANMALHAFSVEFTHPFHGRRIKITAPPPDYFRHLVSYSY